MHINNYESFRKQYRWVKMHYARKNLTLFQCLKRFKSLRRFILTKYLMTFEKVEADKLRAILGEVDKTIALIEAEGVMPQ